MRELMLMLVLVLVLCTARDRYLVEGAEGQVALAVVCQVPLLLPLEAGVEVPEAPETGAAVVSLEVAVVLLEVAASDHLLRILHSQLASLRLASATLLGHLLAFV